MSKNERIKELARQAWKYTNDTVSDREVGHNQDAFEQKFAELLIKDCLEQVAKIGNDAESSHQNKEIILNTVQSTSAVIYKQIKNHFGIEK